MDRRYRTLVAAWFFALAAACFAQDKASIEFEFKVFGVGHDHYDGLYYYNDETFEPLEFHRTHRSARTYKYEGPLTFAIYVKNPAYTAADPQSKPYVKISESTPPVGVKRQLIVFAASPLNRQKNDHQRRFSLYHIDDNQAVFRRNMIVFVNTTGAELYGRVGDSQISLPTGHSSPIRYTSEKSNNKTTIAFALETKQGAKLVMSNDLKIPDNRRVLLILEPPRRPGSLRTGVRMLSESIFPEEEQETALD
ncbi:MAG: hypothetical protein R6U56_10655 [Opitutales bacterium]